MGWAIILLERELMKRRKEEISYKPIIDNSEEELEVLEDNNKWDRIAELG